MANSLLRTLGVYQVLDEPSEAASFRFSLNVLSEHLWSPCGNGLYVTQVRPRPLNRVVDGLSDAFGWVTA